MEMLLQRDVCLYIPVTLLLLKKFKYCRGFVDDWFFTNTVYGPWPPESNPGVKISMIQSSGSVFVQDLLTALLIVLFVLRLWWPLPAAARQNLQFPVRLRASASWVRPTNRFTGQFEPERWDLMCPLERPLQASGVVIPGQVWLCALLRAGGAGETRPAAAAVRKGIWGGRTTGCQPAWPTGTNTRYNPNHCLIHLIHCFHGNQQYEIATHLSSDCS